MIVTLNELLPEARSEGYAVGLFNTTDTDMLEAVIAAAEAERAPVIIGTAEILLPYGELKLIGPAMVAAAERASVPVVVHYDHGLTFDRCMEALRLGFSSIMFDGSAGDPAENVAATREVTRIAHSFGASVEAEIGHVGNADASSAVDRYTTVEEAVAFIQRQNVRSSRLHKLMNILQIRGRSLTPAEERYVNDWLEMGFDDEALASAYERTCLNTGGLRWAYMNKILLRWQEQGLLTGEQVRTGDRKAVPQGASGQLGQAELDAIEKLMKE
jgi:DnaD/phage-associated family protein